MELNKGWREGTIGAPKEDGKAQIVHFYVKANKRKSKNGIDGGKITGLILNTKDNTLAYYAGQKGWIIKPDENDEATMIAYAICLKDYN